MRNPRIRNKTPVPLDIWLRKFATVLKDENQEKQRFNVENEKKQVLDDPYAQLNTDQGQKGDLAQETNCIPMWRKSRVTLRDVRRTKLPA